MNSILRKIIIGVLILILILIFYFFLGPSPKQKKITWGVNFSSEHTRYLGLDWKETYSALLEDLNVKHIKILTQWNVLESKKDNYYFNDLDWQVKEAEKAGADIILVLGRKTGRWPECHIPDWVKGLSKEQEQREVLNLIKETVLRYKESEAVIAWQVENEPFFPYGECSWHDKDFLREEIKLVKKLDSKRRPVIISDSGEFSLWWRAASLGDFVGITLHRRVWSGPFGIYINHWWFPPIYYSRRVKIVEKLFGKKVIGVELQAEPWGPKLLYDISLKEQKKTMDLEKFKENVEFAKRTGLDTFYFWGAEWWFWLKEEHKEPEIWNEAKKLF